MRPCDSNNLFEKFDQAELPSVEEFYSILNIECITKKDCNHAKNVWNTFNLKTVGEYHVLSLKAHVLLLADMFEQFRKTCFEYYESDPCLCFSMSDD